MGLFGAIVGSSLGVTSVIATNAVRKAPFFRSPWEHVAAGGLGLWAGSSYSSFIARREADLDREFQNFRLRLEKEKATLKIMEDFSNNASAQLAAKAQEQQNSEH